MSTFKLVELPSGKQAVEWLAATGHHWRYVSDSPLRVQRLSDHGVWLTCSGALCGSCLADVVPIDVGMPCGRCGSEDGSQPLGSYPHGDVADEVRQDIESKHPGVRIVGFRSGSALDLENQPAGLAFLPAPELGGWVAFRVEDGS